MLRVHEPENSRETENQRKKKRRMYFVFCLNVLYFPYPPFFLDINSIYGLTILRREESPRIDSRSHHVEQRCPHLSPRSFVFTCKERRFSRRLPGPKTDKIGFSNNVIIVHFLREDWFMYIKIVLYKRERETYFK